jgi:hypothetical protein
MKGNGIGLAVMLAGTDEQKQPCRPPISAGEVVRCRGVSKSDVDTAHASLGTSAVAATGTRGEH